MLQASACLYVGNATSVFVSQNVFAQNKGEKGAAIFMNSCDNAQVQFNVFSNNSATQSGGAVFR